MSKYEENISDNSIWVTSTPTPLAQTLPFYVTEAGHFNAGSDYSIERDTHDSFLLLYTVNGEGAIKTGSSSFKLPKDYAVIIDCHIPHEYHTESDTWEFLWLHIKGEAIKPLFDTIYPNQTVNAVKLIKPHEFCSTTLSLINKAEKTDIINCIDISVCIHTLLNILCHASLENENSIKKTEPSSNIQSAIAFIEENYSSPVSIDDMVQEIHISKYHFIRQFRRIMGITPYSYLTNYRINMSKTLLRTTDKTVSEISEACGFLDTSNFITQFKKHTGQKPLQYRRDFT